MQIHRTETSKPVDRFVQDLADIAEAKGFLAHSKSEQEMAHVFGRHGVEVAADLNLHMIEICKPDKAARSISINPERSVLIPKFIMTFSENGLTRIRFVHYRPETVSALVDDYDFPASLTESFAEIIEIIEEARQE